MPPIRRSVRRVSSRSLLAAALTLATVVSADRVRADEPLEPAELTARLDALFSAAYAPDDPGAAVIVVRGEEVLLREGYGMADLEMDVPVEPEMVFRIGSLTKQFTAAAVLMLVESHSGAGELRAVPPFPRKRGREPARSPTSRTPSKTR